MKVLETIKARDGGCVGRGQLPGECWGGLVPHHIVNRGMGGSKMFDGPEWQLTMCEKHNSEMESNPRTALAARDLGFKIPRNNIKPEQARVHYWNGWCLLVGDKRVRQSG